MFLLLIGLSGCVDRPNELVEGQGKYRGLGQIEGEKPNNKNEEVQENQGFETPKPDLYISYQYEAFFYDLFRFEVVDITYGFKDRRNKDTCVLDVIFKENYNTYIPLGQTTEFDMSFEFYQQIYQGEIEESGEIETYSKLCVSPKVAHLFEVGKEYIAQGGRWNKVKATDGEEIGCIDLTFFRHDGIEMDVDIVNCLAEVNQGKVYPKEFSYGIEGLHMSFYQTFLDLNQYMPNEQTFTSGDSCEEFMIWLKAAYTHINTRPRPPFC